MAKWSVWGTGHNGETTHIRKCSLWVIDQNGNWSLWRNCHNGEIIIKGNWHYGEMVIMGKRSLWESGHYGEIMGIGQLGKEKQQQQETPGRAAANVCMSRFECVSYSYIKPMCTSSSGKCLGQNLSEWRERADNEYYGAHGFVWME